MGESSERETVLLAEDEPAVRRFVRLALEEGGYRVIEARDGAEAVGLFERHGAAIDVALLDLSMPRLGGGEALRAMRSRAPALPAVLMTGRVETSTAGESEPDALPPDVPLLAKPFHTDDLLDQVRRSLRRATQGTRASKSGSRG